ncbi:hypothetical protein IEN85_17060 [Pelagicoccus sp. NFK12]|uniref:Uncharacterized protein n=1 Tax=Pelagicoccus enzymogenes TaxID=2773457 RepID=A0A927IIX2_9BACT|nr:hypothetical protein [Pelagicoccus enzymogenes]MBD5781213.1 hypothetical protein [Pelagicoccus enzymogenes]
MRRNAELQASDRSGQILQGGRRLKRGARFVALSEAKRGRFSRRPLQLTALSISAFSSHWRTALPFAILVAFMAPVEKVFPHLSPNQTTRQLF